MNSVWIILQCHFCNNAGIVNLIGNPLCGISFLIQPRKVRILAPAFFQLCQLKLMIGNDLAIVTFKQRMSGFSETCFEPVLPQSSLFYSTVNCYRNILVGMGLNKPGMLATKYGQKKILESNCTVHSPDCLVDNKVYLFYFSLLAVTESRCFLRYSEDFSFLTRAEVRDFMRVQNWSGPVDSVFATKKSKVPGNGCLASFYMCCTWS